MRAGKRRALLGLVLLAALSTSLYAANMPRDMLWGVEQACLLAHRTTGSPFPCLQVDTEGGGDRGFVVLRAPLERTHIVVMPIRRLSGIEAPAIYGADAPNYLQDAWNARHFVQDARGRPTPWDDLGMAVNSRSTRSQDQLHIHVDCVNRSVRHDLAQRLAKLPTGSWQASGFVFHGHAFWARLVDQPSLEGLNVFQMTAEIPELRERPAETLLAVLGVTKPDGGNGFVLLAAQSDPSRAWSQFTSEHLLDHSCGMGHRYI